MVDVKVCKGIIE